MRLIPLHFVDVLPTIPSTTDAPMKLCPKCGKKFTDDANFCPVDAARLSPIEREEPATDTMAARYELRERLGGSRTGVVCRAVDKQTQATVAIKILSAQATATTAAMQRVERELKQLERLQHTGIAKVFASGKRDEQLWVATELVDGARPLSEVVRTHGPLSSSMAAELVEHIGEALIEAAQLGVVHHDLAPKNVLLAGSDIKLINFSAPVSAGEQVPGVPEFVSPEQVEGKAPDQRSNIYSLGALFYFALTGTAPFRGEAAAVHASHLAGSIKPPSQLVSIPPELEAVLLRSLERSPSKRYLTVRQFIDEVVRVTREGGTTDVRSTQPMGRAGRPRAELVQTLLGLPGDHLRAAAAKATEAAKAGEVAKAQPAVAPAPVEASVAPEPKPPEVTAPAPVAAAPLAAPVAAPVTTPAPIAAAPAVTGEGVAADRSPWAPPSSAAAAAGAAPAAAPAAAAGAMAEAQAAVTAAAPALAAIAPAPTPIAPEVASPMTSTAATPAASEPAAPKVAGASGARRKKTEEPENKGKFRETLWFKKGELDAAAAEAAAAERQRTGKEVDRDKADSLPMDERYKDDGTISHGDKDKYSLKTGGTQMLPAIRDKAGSSTQVSADELIGEMKSGRGKYIVAIVLGVVGIALLVALVATR